ncbi:MAG: bile acid:sodium symporter family protein [Saprospiraceae bacterium]|nr:bile acid:sodium symporter family protein [Lewinellaceae bacterium]MBP6810501.1 bile acid:sodium symporter family protein [Saprospiraceae bacterium]
MSPAFFVDLSVGSVLALVMFGVGLSLTFTDFMRVVRHPRAFFTALTVQMLALPTIAFIIALLLPVPAEIKVGFIILAASPGGATSGFLTYLWRGNVALSLSLTAVNSLLTLISIPIVVNMGLRIFLGKSSDLHLPFWDTVGHIFFITIIPAFLGILLRKMRPSFAERISKPAKYVMLGLLAIVFAVKLFGSESVGGTGLNGRDILLILPVAFLQNAACLFTGYFALRYMGMPHPSRLTAAMESGVQNTTLAFLIAGNMLQNPEMVKPALIYSMFSFWTACIFAWTTNKMAGRDTSLRH